MSTVPVAEIVSVRGRFVLAKCPLCQNHHSHARTSLGSAEVLAGCHRPHEKLQTYALPANPPKRKNR